jgi:hypothetical protein
MAERGALPPIRRIAAYGLPAGGEHVAASGLAVDDEPSLVRMAASQRLSGIALAAADAGWLDLAPDCRDELLDRHRAAMLWALGIERVLLRLFDGFDAAGIRGVVLKGPAFAHSIYPDPSWRPFADLDVLVLTSDWRRACAVLGDEGFHRDLPEPRPRFDERFGKAASHSDRGGHQVDLHRNLVLGPYGFLMDPTELFGRTTEFVLAGRTLRRLDGAATVIHASLHASLGAWPPMSLPLRDVAQAAWRDDVDWDDLAALATSWHVLPVVAHALRTSARWLAVDLPEAAAAITRIEPTGADRLLLRAYMRERRRGGMTLASIPHIPGIRGRASYIRALLVPDAPFLAARSPNGQRPSYLRRWKVPFRWLVSRRQGVR